MRLWLVLVVGCSFQHGVMPASDGGPDGAVDAEIDAAPDAFDPNCFGKSPFTICLSALPTTDATLPMSVNTSPNGNNNCGTSGGVTAMVGAVQVCAIAGTNITVSGTVVGVSGSRPLVLVATDTITVSTTNFDITSRTSSPSGDGPNANPAACTTGATLDGTSGMGGSSGGAGGSFGGKGAGGGDAVDGNIAGAVAADPPATFDVLRGGCRGGTGAAGIAGSTPAIGGSGGGALYMVAGNAIMVTGTINASGAGGRGGVGSRGGGGGGGSGGMIVLHAPTLSLDAAARVFANGGGGGGGAGQTLTNGANGGDPLTADTAASGGVRSGSDGSNGSAGAFKSTAPATVSSAGQGGGGGGGGGVGVIRILSGQSVAPINVSPTPIID